MAPLQHFPTRMWGKMIKKEMKALGRVDPPPIHWIGNFTLRPWNISGQPIESVSHIFVKLSKLFLRNPNSPVAFLAHLELWFPKRLNFFKPKRLREPGRTPCFKFSIENV